ncbi:hypothetical protein E0K83_12485 [Gramella sp. BOM4]|nr:hypothetical protein [Christiangramia bathymodioli]
MGLNALISIDLKNNDIEKCEIFIEEMINKQWSLMEEVSNTWVTSFNEGVTREKALSVIQNDIQESKMKSQLDTISLAVQLAEEDIVVGEF